MEKLLYVRNFNVRVTEATAERIERAAHEDKRKPTSWIREIIRKALDAGDKRRQRADVK